MTDLLSRGDIDKHLNTLKDWHFDAGSHRSEIRKSFKFKNFLECFGFMTCVALLAESHNHPPEWSNVYNRLEIVLSTHDAGGVTEKDLGLAQAIGRLDQGM